ncbi:hypothetical protein [Amycolatopsis sp. RTGN1]|uniref:hypothetical protein n=1 Tax=Amycolatopsis ponsaeliensis TaxID=2992142 RepID=UPI00254E0B3B|nr:hypothetical protein [Amycolatopsis sp. RTGN1]
MITEVDFDIPQEIAERLAAGELIRWGGVVRNPAGRLVAHLKEISASKPNEDVVEAAAWMLKKPVVIAGLATLTVVGTATAAVAIVRKRKRVQPECVKNYNDSLRAYIEAVRNQSLDAEIIDRLIADLGAVKAYSENGNITVDFSVEQSDSIDLDEFPESTPTSTDAPVVDLRRYLEVQRKLFNDAA